MKLSDLTSKTKTITFDYDGETVTMDVRTALVTPKLVADLTHLAQDTNDPSETAARMHSVSEHLARLVARWDVEDVDGTMFPLDADRLSAEVPMELQARCLLEAIQALQPGEERAPGDSANKPFSGAIS